MCLKDADAKWQTPKNQCVNVETAGFFVVFLVVILSEWSGG
jgi:hypothetical protein